jgi:hypothetical protein
MFIIKLIILIYTYTFAFIHFSPYNNITNVPICKKCEYFSDHKCKLFGNYNIITGEQYYFDCTVVRYDETKCGIDGKFFFQKIPFQKI